MKMTVYHTSPLKDFNYVCSGYDNKNQISHIYDKFNAQAHKIKKF